MNLISINMNRDELDVHKEIYKIENKQTQCKTKYCYPKNIYLTNEK